MTSFTSPTFQFILHGEKGTFDLIPVHSKIPSLEGCRIQTEIIHRDRKDTLLFKDFETGEIRERWSNQGHLVEIQAVREYQNLGITCRAFFALSLDFPLFQWKIQLENHSEQAVKVNKIQFLQVGGQEKLGSLGNGASDDNRWSFYSNGWQSWSPSGAYPNGEPMRISRLGFLQQPMIINSGTPVIRHPGYYTSDFFAAVVNLTTRSGLTVGFLSQKQHFGSIEAVLYDRPSLGVFTSDSSRLDPGAEIETDWAVITPIESMDADPFGGYLEAVAREHSLTEADLRPMPNGWCSWYQYYGNLAASDVLENLQELSSNRSRLPLDLVQIDDGYQTSVGDWFSYKPSFPNGLQPLAKDITALGFTAGLWLAPFILDPGSDLARNNPGLILRNKRGKPVNAGFQWNRLANGIDLTVPRALETVLDPVQKAVESGFRYLKLDFLYAAALPGLHYDPTWTRARIMRQGMERIRATAGPDTYLVGCGLPLGAGIGLVDAMRISADVAPAWDPEFHGIGVGIRHEPAMPSVRNALHNTISRAPIHKRWWVNDPDCLLVRPNSNLTLAEVQSLATGIGMTGGAVLLSDDLTSLPPERLRIAQVLLPVLEQRGEVLDLLTQASPERMRQNLHGPIGDWTIIAHFNWLDTPKVWVFRPQEYGLQDFDGWFSSFWDEQLYHVEAGVPLQLPSVPAHGVCLAAVFSSNIEDPNYLGSNLHFSQGREVESWVVHEDSVAIRIHTGHSSQGFIRLHLPHPPLGINVNGQPALWQSVFDEVYQISLNSAGAVEVLIHF